MKTMEKKHDVGSFSTHNYGENGRNIYIYIYIYFIYLFIYLFTYSFILYYLFSSISRREKKNMISIANCSFTREYPTDVAWNGTSWNLSWHEF